jgi:uncharacterized membrane protein HdeD (DUF308 family)
MPTPLEPASDVAPRPARGRSRLTRWTLLIGGVAILAGVVLLYPPAAAPIGVGLAAFEILYRATRRSK